jgi:molybdate transport system permease protein
MRLSSISRIIVILLACFFGIILFSGIYYTGLDSISGLFGDTNFLQSVIFSLKTSLVATALAFILGVPSGFFLARNNTLVSRFMDVLFDIPIVIPPLIVGVLLVTFFNIPVIRNFYSFIFTTPGAIAAQFFIAVPFTIKSSKSAFELVPPIYERIAMTLGAKPIRSFFDTTYKIAFPGILSGLILTWLRCVGEFGATLMVGGGIQGKTENIPINVYLHMISGDHQKGVTAGIMTVGLALICILFINMVFLNTRNRLSQG